MIYIATVHWQSDKWIKIQDKYLRKYITEEYRVFASLNDLPNDHSHMYYYSDSSKIKSHEVKLNVLSEKILNDSNDDKDIIIFIDGDAFPINNLLEFSRPLLKKHKLIAIKRVEEDGEQQPHPSFCMTTIGFWKEIKGDWTRGYKWKRESGPYTTDVGGNLLGKLIQNKINWHPLLRSNIKNLHPVLFGVYEDMIYHHGAGFRYPTLRINEKNAWLIHRNLSRMITKFIPEKIRHIIPHSYRIKFISGSKIAAANNKLSNQLYDQLLNNNSFIDSLMSQKTHNNEKGFKNLSSTEK